MIHPRAARFLPLFLLISLTVPPAAAQLVVPSVDMPGAEAEGEIIREPICSALINRSDQTIIGTLSTASQKVQTGDVVKHRSNFRLAAGEKMEFCSSGPFYEGRRLEDVLRTLIPLFDCKTKIDEPVYLDAIEGTGGFRKLSATCK